MSYYALFQGWLLLSQPPGCLRDRTSFPLSTRLGALAGDPGCFPLDHEAYPPQSHCHATHPHGIRSLADLSNPVRPLSHPVALPPPGNTRRCTKMHFGENQLSRSLIGLSPLPTAHPPGFQPRWVRSSTRSYTRLNLAMGRSPRFGSIPRHSQPPCSDSLSLRLPLPGLTSRHGNDSQAHSSIGTPPPPPHTRQGGRL